MTNCPGAGGPPSTPTQTPTVSSKWVPRIGSIPDKFTLKEIEEDRADNFNEDKSLKTKHKSSKAILAVVWVFLVKNCH
jgi:hypothetical protein